MILATNLQNRKKEEKPSPISQPCFIETQIWTNVSLIAYVFRYYVVLQVAAMPPGVVGDILISRGCALFFFLFFCAALFLSV